ncbi:MAG: hydroxymethylbilane synthase [Fibrobacter sp.]|jgi:hydroxymethylbilane synthase|nr:hydroxymethylbilane synthase [Fibrobacter sp.]
MSELTVRLGTRGSPLALAQARLAAEAFETHYPGIHVEIKVIHTSGDKDRVRSLVSMSGSGVFVKELEDALIRCEADVAVHSLKDVPSQMDSRLHLAGFLKRESPYDVLVSREFSFNDLPAGAKIGTGSPRRILQLRKLRPDLKFVNLRGNLETRIHSVTSELDAAVLGAAGLNRLKLSQAVTQVFKPEEVIPAIGQGIIGLQCLAGNKEMNRMLTEISDQKTLTAARTERRWMNLLGGGCRVPMAALLLPENEGYRFYAYLSEINGKAEHRADVYWSAPENESLMEDFAERFIRECRLKGVPLPSETDEHALLDFWK